MKKYILTAVILSSGSFLYSGIALALIPPPPVPLNTISQPAPLGAGDVPFVMPKNIGQASTATSTISQGVPAGIGAPTSTLQNKIGQTASATLKNFPKGIPLGIAVATSAPPVLTPVQVAAPLKQPKDLLIQSATSTMKAYQSVPEEPTSTPMAQSEKKSHFSRFIAFFKNLFSQNK